MDLDDDAFGVLDEISTRIHRAGLQHASLQATKTKRWRAAPDGGDGAGRVCVRGAEAVRRMPRRRDGALALKTACAPPGSDVGYHACPGIVRV